MSSSCREEVYRIDKAVIIWRTCVNFVVLKIKVKKNLKWITWGLDVGEED